LDITAGNVATAGSIVFYIAANTAGSYAGTYQAQDASGDIITSSWSFTTVGVPTSLTLTAAASEIVAGGTTTATATVLDANNAQTQLGSFDSVTSVITGGANAGTTTLTDLNFADGTHSIAYTGSGTPATAGTITITPRGTLSALAAKTVTIRENSTAIDTTAITAGLVVTAPDDALVADTNLNTAQAVRPGTSTITVQITAPTAGTFGKIFRLKGVVQSGGTISGTLAGAASTEAYVDITTSATTGKGTGTFTIGGASTLATKTLTITQANAALAGVGTLNTVITQTAPTFAAANNTFSPTGNIVAKLGDSTAVTVTVKDQFGKALGSGYNVYVYRGATTAGTYLGQATTAADGTAWLALQM